MPRSVNKTQSKWCINKHGASKIIDTFETYHKRLINEIIEHLTYGGSTPHFGEQSTC
jgi:hypothetical protein